MISYGCFCFGFGTLVIRICLELGIWDLDIVTGLGGRLAVGLWTLAPSTEVRILAPQPRLKESCPRCVGGLNPNKASYCQPAGKQQGGIILGNP